MAVVELNDQYTDEWTTYKESTYIYDGHIPIDDSMIIRDQELLLKDHQLIWTQVSGILFPLWGCQFIGMEQNE